MECVRRYNKIKVTTNDVDGLLTLFKQKGVNVGPISRDNECC